MNRLATFMDLYKFVENYDTDPAIGFKSILNKPISSALIRIDDVQPDGDIFGQISIVDAVSSRVFLTIEFVKFNEDIKEPDTVKMTYTNGKFDIYPIYTDTTYLDLIFDNMHRKKGETSIDKITYMRNKLQYAMEICFNRNDRKVVKDNSSRLIESVNDIARDLKTSCFIATPTEAVTITFREKSKRDLILNVMSDCYKEYQEFFNQEEVPTSFIDLYRKLREEITCRSYDSMRIQLPNSSSNINNAFIIDYNNKDKLLHIFVIERDSFHLKPIYQFKFIHLHNQSPDYKLIVEISDKINDEQDLYDARISINNKCWINTKCFNGIENFRDVLIESLINFTNDN